MIPIKTASLAPASPSPSCAPGLAQDLLFTTMAIYGPTGSRKTTQIGEFAKYVYETTGKKTRLISADQGGHGVIQAHINAGIIELWRLVEEENPKAAIIKASRGCFPKELKNGLRSSAIIIEPIQGNRKAVLKDVGAYAVEGWASICKLIIRDTVSKGQKISEDVVGLFAENMLGEVLDQEEVRKRRTSGNLDGFVQMGAPAKAHYGFVQNFLGDVIRNFSSLPVDRILYTSLEGKGEDRLTKVLQYGPDTAGSAMTAAVPALVGDCLHFEDYSKEAGVDPNNPKQKLVELGVRAWFQAHPDATTGAIWPAKTRVAAESVAEFRKIMGPSGYFDLAKHSLGDYLRVQDELLSRSTDSLRAWKTAADERRKATEAK